MRLLIDGLPGVALEVMLSSLLPVRRKSSWSGWAAGSSVALESRRLASTMPAVNGGSPNGRSGTEATGSESGAPVNSCILDAERRRTPSGLLVLVLDRTLVLVVVRVVSWPDEGPGPVIPADEGSRNGSSSLWLSLDGSGVGTPAAAMDPDRSRCWGNCGSGAALAGGSLGVRIGDGRWVPACCELFRLLLPLLALGLGVSVPLPGGVAATASEGSRARVEDGAFMFRPCLLRRLPSQDNSKLKPY